MFCEEGMSDEFLCREGLVSSKMHAHYLTTHEHRLEASGGENAM
jgi:hypothetical protein